MICFKKILCPIDYSKCSFNALRYAIEMAQKDSAVLYLMHVVDNHVLDYGGLKFGAEPNLDIEMIAAFEKRLTNGIPEEVRNHIQVETLVKVGIPFEEILRVALNREVDLIVMGTHGRTGIANIVIGSVAGKVIEKAPCPVLCIRDRSFFQGTR